MYAFFFLPPTSLPNADPKLRGVPCINFCDIRRIKQCIPPKAQWDERREWMKGDQRRSPASRVPLVCVLRDVVSVYHRHGWHTAINTVVLWLSSPAIWLQLLACLSRWNDYKVLQKSHILSSTNIMWNIFLCESFRCIVRPNNSNTMNILNGDCRTFFFLPQTQA